MRNFLLRRFVKDYEKRDDLKVRERIGKLAGGVGIATNTSLALLKGILGYFSGSIAIMADAVNNLSDAASSVVTLVGFKLAAKEGDKEHPYGHARIEYMAGIFVAALILLVGFRLLTSSYEKVLHPTPVQFDYLTMGLLILAIVVKVWQAAFYYRLGKDIGSLTLKATGADSRNDVIATASVLIALFVGKQTGFNIDGYIGLLVSVFILYSGVCLIRETSHPLLGKAPDAELVQKLRDLILGTQGVIGMHDLIVHDYGPGRVFASVHIEVDQTVDVCVSHEVIDEIERSIMKNFHVELVGHLDPVDLKDSRIFDLRRTLKAELANVEGALGLHDLRILPGEQQINILFDVVLSENRAPVREQAQAILQEKLTALDPKYIAVINFDADYSGEAK